MKNKLLLGALLLGTASLFTSCKDDNGSNPTLIQPTEFTLNTPAYINETVDLAFTKELLLTWSQPKFTADNAPVNATYEIQVSNTNSFSISTAQADADESGSTKADYAVMDRTTQLCSYQLLTEDLDKAMVQLAKWTEKDVPEVQKVYVRISAYVLESGMKLKTVNSNAVQISTNPYYIELKDAQPIMWYLVGNNFGDGAWSNKPGESSFPLFLKTGFAYDKKTGEVVLSGIPKKPGTYTFVCTVSVRRSGKRLVGFETTVTISVMRSPRSSSRSPSVVSSRPSSLTEPLTIRPGARTSPMMERATMDLPQPDSPTMPTTCPVPTVRLTSWTAFTSPRSPKKLVCRCDTSSVLCAMMPP